MGGRRLSDTTTAAGENLLILIGENDGAYLREGWHPVQPGPAGLPCRWISPEAVLELPASDATGGANRTPARLVATVSAPLTLRGLKPGLSVYSGEARLGHCEDIADSDGQWFTVSIDLPAWPAGSVRLAVEHLDPATGQATRLAFVPHEVLGNGDLRELGVQVSSLRIHSR